MTNRKNSTNLFSSIVPSTIVWFQNISMPFPWKVIGNSDREGGLNSQVKVLKENMKLNWNFQRGGVSKQKKPSMGGVWIFSGTTHFSNKAQRGRSLGLKGIL